MKTVLLFVWLWMIPFQALADITPKVDQRIEVLSIVARLAGYAEYNDKQAARYVADIHAYFDRFNTDSIMQFARDIRSESGISFDAVMTMAVNLQQRGRKFSLRPN